MTINQLFLECAAEGAYHKLAGRRCGDSGRDLHMGVSNITGNAQMGAMFAMVRDRAERGVKAAGESERERALEAFHKAERSCDKSVGRMMDKHHESVKKSAEKLAKYLKKKAADDRAREHAEDMRTMSEEILVERINHRNMLEELRVKALNREKILKERTD